MAFHLITLTGTYKRQNGVAATGSVTVTLQTALQDPATNQFRAPYSETDQLDVNGAVSFSVVATNSPGVTPTGVTYLIDETIDDVTRSYRVEIPFDAAGSTVDLADLAPVSSTAAYNYVLQGTQTIEIGVALSDETTAITAGVAKATIRAPFAMVLNGVRFNLNTASSAGIPTVDINEGGVSILSTKLTIDVGEKTSVTAAVPAVFSDSSIADDAEITFDIDVAGTGAKGAKVWLYGTRA